MIAWRSQLAVEPLRGAALCEDPMPAVGVGEVWALVWCKFRGADLLLGAVYLTDSLGAEGLNKAKLAEMKVTVPHKNYEIASMALTSCYWATLQ